MRCFLFASALTTIIAAAPSARAADIPVANATELVAAIAAAAPGDTLVLADGTYALTGVTCGADGTAAEPITVRSATPLGAHIEFDALEGFKVNGAHWHFEGLDVQGVCAVDDNCEHAFHVSGGGQGFVLRHSRVRDFNAQLKVNANTGGAQIPHGGLIEYNEIADTAPRDTSNPVTKLNIDTGDNWVVRGNYIHDFHKNGGNEVSYAAFMKSGGDGGLFERNLVACTRDVNTGGVRIGLSFGGGGTAPEFCAPAFDANVPCDVEHSNGVLKNNIIVSCSDVGIYLNRAANTKVLHNTLIDTTGIDFRFGTTSGEARHNLMMDAIRDRDGASHTDSDNLTGQPLSFFTDLYADPLALDLAVVGDAALVGSATALAEVADDYCARTRLMPDSALGALEHALGDCTILPPPEGSSSSAGGNGAGGHGAGGNGSGGNGAGNAGAGNGAGGAGGASNPASGGDDDGCSCTLPGHRQSDGRGLALGFLALAGGLARQRRLASKRCDRTGSARH